MNHNIERIVTESITEILAGMDKPSQNLKSLPLFGTNGMLDSIALVSLTVILEEKIQDILGFDLMLANEKALSSFNSPFKNFQSLTQYIQALISDEETKNE